MRIIIPAIIILFFFFFWKHFVSLILIEQEQMAPNSLLQFSVKYSLLLKWKQNVKNVIDEIELIVSFYLDQFSMFKHVWSPPTCAFKIPVVWYCLSNYYSFLFFLQWNWKLFWFWGCCYKSWRSACVNAAAAAVKWSRAAKIWPLRAWQLFDVC